VCTGIFPRGNKTARESNWPPFRCVGQRESRTENISALNLAVVELRTVWDFRFSQRWLWRMSSSGMWRCVDFALTDV
jgi:hypothetical protein